MGLSASSPKAESEKDLDCFRQTQDGVLISKNLIEKMLEKDNGPQSEDPFPPTLNEDIQVSYDTDCSGNAKINVTQPLKSVCHNAKCKS